MPSSEEDGTAAAAEQLGSMSLGESVERKAEPDTKPAKLFCSACGKESDTAHKCMNCECVWYCDKDCQMEHRREHRKECQSIEAELDRRRGKLDLGEEVDLGPLPDLAPREECPICMCVLPLSIDLHEYSFCCGKTLCRACDYWHEKKNEEMAAEVGQTPSPLTCAFCRTAVPRSNEGYLVQLRKRVEQKDPFALYCMAMVYGIGQFGLSVDVAKCAELLRESAALGFPVAQFNLGMRDINENKEEGLRHLEAAADGGDVISRYYLGIMLHIDGDAEGGHLGGTRHNVGCYDSKNGNYVAAMRHYRLAASRGYKPAMSDIIGCFEEGVLRHGDLAETLQNFYLARSELRNDDRDRYIEHLKEIGKYNEDWTV